MSGPGFMATASFVTSSFILVLFVLHIFFFDSVETFRPRPPPAPSLSEAPHGEDNSEPWRRDTREYILSPSWDIHASPQQRYYNWTFSEISANPDGSQHILDICCIDADLAVQEYGAHSSRLTDSSRDLWCRPTRATRWSSMCTIA
jgi:hypothetical protein